MRHLKPEIPMEAKIYTYLHLPTPTPTASASLQLHLLPSARVMFRIATLNPSPLFPAGSVRIVLHD